MVSTEAFAIIDSDTLQIGTGQTFGIAEAAGSEPHSVTAGPVSFSTGSISITTLTATIALLDPGTTSISDIVTATIGCTETSTPTPPTTCFGPSVTVTLTSDGETPLAAPSGTFGTVTETGGVQNLSIGSTNFNTLFGLPSGTLPAINVFSDVEAAVPEPASLALLGSGLVGLAFARRRRKS